METAKEHNERGVAYREKGEILNAIIEFTEAINLDPTYILARSNRAGAVLMMSRNQEDVPIEFYAAALSDFEKLLTYTSSDSSIEPRFVQLVKEKYEELIAIIKSKGVALIANSYHLSAFTKIEAGDYDGARSDFRKVIEITPQNAYDYVNLGMAYNGLGEYKKAVENYEIAISKDPNLKERVQMLSEAALRRSTGDSISEFSQAAGKKDAAPKSPDDQFNPKDVRDYYCRGLERMYHCNTDGAIADFEKAIEMESRYIHAYGKLGRLYVEAKDFNKAIEIYEKSLAIQADQPVIKDNLAYVYGMQGITCFNKGDNKNTIIYLSKAIEYGEEYHAIRGITYYEDGQVEAAIKDWEEVLKREPDNEKVKQFLKQARG
jgi:tetratricopeptide (TPR) repeat protein